MNKAQNILNLNPSLVLIPSTGKTGELDSIIPQDGSGDFTVSRNGNATFFDKNGILRTALPNQPRLDFDPLTGEFRGVLVEPAATNVLLNSETPATQTLLMTAAQRTISFYGSGTVTLSGAFSETITGNANPLIRTTFTFTPTDTNLTITPSGNVTRWQLETGSVATSYTPTQGSQVTRPADVITRTNAQDLIGQTEGSLYIEFDRTNLVEGLKHLFSIESNVVGQFNSININTSNNMVNIQFHITVGGVSQGFILATPVSGRNKLLFRYSLTQGNARLFLNGVLISGTIPLSTLPFLDKIALLSRFNPVANFLQDRFYNSHVQQAAVFKRVLTDAEAMALTTL